MDSNNLSPGIHPSLLNGQQTQSNQTHSNHTEPAMDPMTFADQTQMDVNIESHLSKKRDSSQITADPFPDSFHTYTDQQPLLSKKPKLAPSSMPKDPVVIDIIDLEEEEEELELINETLFIKQNDKPQFAAYTMTDMSSHVPSMLMKIPNSSEDSKMVLGQSVASGLSNQKEYTEIDLTTPESENLCFELPQQAPLTDEAQIVEETVKKVYDEMQDYLEGIPQAPQPLKLVCSLMPHQKQALHWLCSQESKDSIRGGILADDMGVGKTVETLALLCARPVAQTLIVCPVTTLSHWRNEIQRHCVKDAWKVTTYYGSSRSKNLEELMEYSIVLTTYGTVSSEFKQWSMGLSFVPDPDLKDGGFHLNPSRSACLLFRIPWGRIVLDEAQYIKNKYSLGAKACNSIPGYFRWCLSGTPIQNTLDDLFSLLKFLRFPDYPDEATWKRYIKSPVMVNKDIGYKNLARLMRRVLLRRRKDQKLNGKCIVELPPVTNNTITLDFDEDDTLFYRSVESKITDQFNMMVSKGSLYVMRNYTHVLVLLLRLRQAACHPYLVAMANETAEVVKSRSWNFDLMEQFVAEYIEVLKSQKDKILKSGGSDKEVSVALKNVETDLFAIPSSKFQILCGICGEIAEGPLITPCGHVFCGDCIDTYSLTHQTCPTCSQIIYLIQLRPPTQAEVDQIIGSAFEPTKQEIKQEVKNEDDLLARSNSSSAINQNNFIQPQELLRAKTEPLHPTSSATPTLTPTTFKTDPAQPTISSSLSSVPDSNVETLQPRESHLDKSAPAPTSQFGRMIRSGVRPMITPKLSTASNSVVSRARVPKGAFLPSFVNLKKTSPSPAPALQQTEVTAESQASPVEAQNQDDQKDEIKSIVDQSDELIQFLPASENQTIIIDSSDSSNHSTPMQMDSPLPINEFDQVTTPTSTEMFHANEDILSTPITVEQCPQNETAQVASSFTDEKQALVAEKQPESHLDVVQDFLSKVTSIQTKKSKRNMKQIHREEDDQIDLEDQEMLERDENESEDDDAGSLDDFIVDDEDTTTSKPRKQRINDDPSSSNYDPEVDDAEKRRKMEKRRMDEKNGASYSAFDPVHHIQNFGRIEMVSREDSANQSNEKMETNVEEKIKFETVHVPTPRTFSIKSDPNVKKLQKLKRYSTKGTALMNTLELVYRSGSNDKIVIYSQFTRFMDIIQLGISSLWDWKTVRLDGTMNHPQREEVLHAFNTDPSIRIIIISLKAGGVGVNLTVANHIILMDPWWNSAVEKQAIDRVHRIGQTKPIFVTRFIVKLTVEERILQIQAQKDKIADRALSNRRQDASNTPGLSFAELKQLFTSSYPQTQQRIIVDN